MAGVAASGHVTWTDVAPRDGLQNITEDVATDVKVRLIRGLLEAGAPRVEATSFVSPMWVPQLADATSVLAEFDSNDKKRLRVLIPNRRGLELAMEHGIGNVLFTVGATESFNQRNVNRSMRESLDELRAIVIEAAGAGCHVDVALSVAFGCPFEGRVEPHRVAEVCAELADAGATEVGVADTIGVTNPAAVREMVGLLVDVIPRGKLSLHFHDTRGLAVANVMAAYEAGVTLFDGSAGGVGGCPFAPRSTGNVCSEDALQALVALGAGIDADLSKYCAVSEQLATDLGHDVPGKLYRAGLWSAPQR